MSHSGELLLGVWGSIPAPRVLVRSESPEFSLCMVLDLDRGEERNAWATVFLCR